MEPLPNTCSLTMLQSSGIFAERFFSYHAQKQWNFLFWHPSHSILPCLQNCIKNSSYTQYHKWFKIPSSYFCLSAPLPPPPPPPINGGIAAGTVLKNLLWKHVALWGQDVPTRLQLKRCIFCSRVPSFLICAVWAWSCCQLWTVTNSGWRLNNCSLKIWLLFLISSSVSFGLCIQLVVVTTICEMSN